MSTIRLRPAAAASAEAPDPTRYFTGDLLKADPSRRSAASFDSDGNRLAGHLYRPPSVSDDELTPGVVLYGPISSLKEQTLPHYAERLADAGYTALTFDPRNFGESDGTPRFRYDPNVVIVDYANAVNYLLTREDVDPSKVGVVGVCMGGGYALSLGARDKRLKVVVSIAGGHVIGGTFQQVLGVEGFATYYQQINALVQHQNETGDISYVPTIARQLSPDVPVAAMPNEEAHSYYDRTRHAEAPNWSNSTTVDSFLPYFSYNAIAHAPLVAPIPLMIIHGTTDAALLPEYGQQAYDAAQGPKELIWIETHNHIELYDQDPYVSDATQHAVRWLDQGLNAPTTQ